MSSVSIDPNEVVLDVGGEIRLAAIGKDSLGEEVPIREVTWTTSDGNIARIGQTDDATVLVSGVAPGSAQVVGTAEGVNGAATIRILAVDEPDPPVRPSPAPILIDLVLTPASVELSPGGTNQFAVSATWSDGSRAAPPVTFSATGGNMTTSGLYTAGETAGAYLAIVAQQDGDRADTSRITITGPATLRSLATARGFSIGAAVRDSAFRDEARYRETLATQYNSIVPEDATDFLPIHPGRTQYSFAAADALVDFAQANGMAFHGHHLVWYAWIPTWVTNGGYTDEQLRDVLKDHISTVVGRYRGRAASWDVVNEVIDNQACYSNQCVLRPSFWLSHLGAEYIDSAFVWAHRADPNAKLYLNEFRTETIMNKSDALLALAKGLKSRGIPIDGVGFQMHILQQSTPAPTSAQVQANLQRFADAGFDIRITEMDVAIPDTGGESTLEAQARVYRDILNACLNVSRCKELTTWGFSDRYNWVPKSFPGYGRALPFDSNYQAKPAFMSLLARLGQP